MKRILTLSALLVLALMLAFATGCGEKAEAKAECAGCGMEFDQEKAVDVDGKTMCPKCAKPAEGAEDVAQHSCVKCGMKMADADMVEQDDQWYCSHCAPEGAADHDQGDDHEGHDHG